MCITLSHVILTFKIRCITKTENRCKFLHMSRIWSCQRRWIPCCLKFYYCFAIIYASRFWSIWQLLRPALFIIHTNQSYFIFKTWYVSNWCRNWILERMRRPSNLERSRNRDWAYSWCIYNVLGLDVFLFETPPFPPADIKHPLWTLGGLTSGRGQPSR